MCTEWGDRDYQFRSELLYPLTCFLRRFQSAGTTMTAFPMQNSALHIRPDPDGIFAINNVAMAAGKADTVTS